VLTGDDRNSLGRAGGGFGALGANSARPGSAQNGAKLPNGRRAALDALREGRAGEAAAAYSHHGRVRRSTNPAELIGDMVERWWAARESGDDAVLYAYSRDAVPSAERPCPSPCRGGGRAVGPELVVGEFAPVDLAPRCTGS